MRIDCPVFSCNAFWTREGDNEADRVDMRTLEFEHWIEYHETPADKQAWAEEWEVEHGDR